MSDEITSDLTFITNKDGATLKERFETLIKGAKNFDCLVGYFYTTGFHLIYKTLENTDRIRILIGIGTGKKTYDLIKKAQQEKIIFSHKETKEKFSSLITEEMESSEDIKEVEQGIDKFVEWIKSGKLEIRAYPSKNLHAKHRVYQSLIMKKSRVDLVCGFIRIFTRKRI